MYFINQIRAKTLTPSGTNSPTAEERVIKM